MKKWNRPSIGMFIQIISCFSVMVVFGQNDVYLKVQSSNYNPIPLVILPFDSPPRNDWILKMRDVLVSDLDFTGLIKILPMPTPTVPINAFAFIETRCSSKNDEVEIKTTLRDADTREVIFEKTFITSSDNFQKHAHEWSDAILFHLTGEQGIAQTKIAYTVKGKRVETIMVSDYDGWNIHQASRDDSLNLSPCWSPDGSKICYTTNSSGRSGFSIFDMVKRQSTLIPCARGMYSTPVWSPDGKKIAFTWSIGGNAEIYCMDETGNAIQRLTNNAAIDCSPSWSPDGREFAFTSDRSGSPQIFMMDSYGGNVRRLTYSGSYNDSPAWSPIGDLIAFVSRGQTGFQIMTIDVNGENLRQLTDDPYSHEDPSWAPNGMHFLFAANPNQKWDIYAMRADGSGHRQLTNSGVNISPSWSPYLTRSGKMD